MATPEDTSLEAILFSDIDKTRSKILELVFSVPEDWQAKALEYLDKNYPETFVNFSRAYGQNIIGDFGSRKPGTKLADLVYWIPCKHLEIVYQAFNSMFPEDVRQSPERRIRSHFTEEKIDWSDRGSWGRLY